MTNNNQAESLLIYYKLESTLGIHHQATSYTLLLSSKHYIEKRQHPASSTFLRGQILGSLAT